MAQGQARVWGGVPAAVESAVGRIEQAAWLDRAGQAMGSAVGRVLHPGRMKDLLSGTWLGHPAHPMLTDLPLGAWTSALLLDLAGQRGAPRAADALIGAGVLAALPTALSGLSDLADLGTTRERAVAGAHALGNLVAVGLFGASWLARRGGRRGTGVALSGGATALVLGAGFLGGHLAFRRGIGVDHTVFEEEVTTWTPVLAAADLADGVPTLAQAGGSPVLLVRQGESICALADHCSHAGAPLHEGSLQQGRITCPWHGSVFDLDGGAVVRGPATAPQPAYDVRLEGGTVEVRRRS